MSAQSSLKALADAALERAKPRTLFAQNEKKAAQYPHIAQKAGNLQHLIIELIRAWLFRIGEPEEDHYIVLDKCRRDPEALTYFVKHASQNT